MPPHIPSRGNNFLLRSQISYRSGNILFKDWGVHQASSQKLVWQPAPTHILLFSKQRFLTFKMTVQQAESNCLCSTKAMRLLWTYLAFTNLRHKPSWLSNFYYHLHNKPVLIFSTSLIPKPPFLFGLQIYFHFIIWYFLTLLPARRIFYVS